MSDPLASPRKEIDAICLFEKLDQTYAFLCSHCMTSIAHIASVEIYLYCANTRAHLMCVHLYPHSEDIMCVTTFLARSASKDAKASMHLS